jgi:hypothetical protein
LYLSAQQQRKYRDTYPTNVKKIIAEKLRITNSVQVGGRGEGDLVLALKKHDQGDDVGASLNGVGYSVKGGGSMRMDCGVLDNKKISIENSAYWINFVVIVEVERERDDLRTTGEWKDDLFCRCMGSWGDGAKGRSAIPSGQRRVELGRAWEKTNLGEDIDGWMDEAISLRLVSGYEAIDARTRIEMMATTRVRVVMLTSREWRDEMMTDRIRRFKRGKDRIQRSLKLVNSPLD